MEIITAVIYRPGQRGEIIKIEPTLEKLQELVGGYVQVVRIAPESREENPLMVIVNEEGRLKGLPYCRSLPYWDDKSCLELVGPIVITGEWKDIEDETHIKGLTSADLHKVIEIFGA